MGGDGGEFGVESAAATYQPVARVFRRYVQVPLPCFVSFSALMPVLCPVALVVRTVAHVAAGPHRRGVC